MALGLAMLNPGPVEALLQNAWMFSVCFDASLPFTAVLGCAATLLGV